MARPRKRGRPTRRPAAATTRRRRSSPGPVADPGAEIARLGVALAGAPDLARGLDELLASARRVTGAQAGTVYLRRGDFLEFAAVQNDILARRLGAAEVRNRLAARPLSLREASIASYVVLTRATVNLHDAYEIPMDRPYTLFREVDRKADYRTRSMLATPLRDGRGRVFGVLQLINALDRRGKITAFSPEHQTLVQTLAGYAAHLPAPTSS
jgi:GAF domain-containing protein